MLATPPLAPAPCPAAPGRTKVFHLCDKFGIRGSRTHGVSRLFTWWFPRFDAARHDLRLIGIRREDEASRHLREQGLDPQCLGRSRLDPRVIGDLLRLVRQERPHLLHAHGYATANFARVVSALTGVPTIVHEHTAFPTVPGYQRAVDRALARHTALGIAVSGSVKAFMIRNRSMPPERIEVVYNGVPLEEFRTPSAERIARQRSRLGLAPGDCVIGTVGRLDEQKGITYFLRSAAEIARARPDVRFVIAGDGHLMEQHRQEARALGLAERAIFAGFCDDVPALQALLDIQVFSSIYEGTPLTAFEAMAMRRPIVSTATDGLAEVLRDGESARLVPPRDPGRLAAAVLELLARPAEAARLAERAERDSRRYDIQRTVDRMQELYRHVLERRG